MLDSNLGPKRLYSLLEFEILACSAARAGSVFFKFFLYFSDHHYSVLLCPVPESNNLQAQFVITAQFVMTFQSVAHNTGDLES